MKLLLALIFILNGIAIHTAPPAIILPGTSVECFVLNKTQQRDVTKALKQGVLSKHSWHATHCGMTYYWYTLSYPERGIAFTFKKEKVHKSDLLKSIDITEKFNGTLENGITIGHSTKKDILHFYGQPNDTMNTESMYYSKQGINFKFRKPNEELSDTLVGMTVFVPWG